MDLQEKFDVILSIINLCTNTDLLFYKKTDLKYPDEHIERCFLDLINEMNLDQKQLESLKYAYSEFHSSFVDEKTVRGVDVYTKLLNSASGDGEADEVDIAVMHAMAAFQEKFDYSALLEKSAAEKAAAIERFNQMVSRASDA